ncbi:MAG: 3-hydroxyacyl-CoA dehydrogenase family protein [Kutzneria sp.]|nr:3-hydroxyacyl-CoA dehydrogenase family protein [Kutzneria sp.]MBV9846530.1 3-hydroxyacyl-CoA dehydrogenase family protein [Kutzneria sp.]
MNVGVLGGGRMGAGIAQVFAGIGANVVVVESDDSAADAAGTRLDAGLRLAAERGTLDGSLTDAQRRVRIVTDITELPSDSALVIEAVPEVGEMKVRVLTAAERAVSSDTVLASNTSSLSIGELGSVLVRPERFLGMHFFNPVPVSTLVEVVLGPNTGERTQRRALDWIALLGKTPVLVKDSPGFATSRLGVMLGLEAIRTLQEGVADAESIDRAMELGYGHPMGPLRSTDLVGLDVRLAIAEHLWQTLGDRFAPPKLLREKVARGELGRKTGTGFYSWPSP